MTEEQAIAIAKRCSEVAHQLRDEGGHQGVIIVVKGANGIQYMGTCQMSPLDILQVFSATASSIAMQITSLELPIVDRPPSGKLNA